MKKFINYLFCLSIICLFQNVDAQQTFTDYQAADLVVGQSNFTGGNGSCTQASTNGPSYCAISSKGMLAVANQTGYRTQLWTSTVTSNGQLPQLVLGETSFTNCSGGVTQSLTSWINGVAFSPDGNKIMISDFDNNRVLIWNTIPKSNGKAADVVLGQANFTSSASGIAADKLYGPLGLFVSSDGKLLVADGQNNRVLIWNSIPTVNGTPADVVIGQTNFSTSTNGDGANELYEPWGIWVSPEGKLLIADIYNNRVLIYNTIPTSNNAYADVVIGQTGFGMSNSGLSQTEMSGPVGVTVSPDGKLAIGEFYNNRVLIYNSIPTTNGAAADVVLGQPDFYTNQDFYPSGNPSSQNMYHPYNVSFDLYGRLFVAGREMNRVLVYGVIPNLEAELQIQLSSGSTIFCPDSAGTITVTIMNNGPDTATGIISTASLPASFNYTSSTTSTGTYNNTSGYWNISSLASGATATLTINGISTTSGYYTAYANIIQSNQTDNNLYNNGTSLSYDVNCPCSGTPTVGTAVSSDNPVCSGISFTLSLTGMPPVGGLTYQWQSSTDNATFTNIAIATNSTYSASQTSEKYYRCKVTCSLDNSVSYSSSVYVTMNSIADCFCIPEQSSYTCSSWISKVMTSGGVTEFNKTSSCASSSYSNFSSSNTASNTQLSTTTMTFTSSGSYMAFSVWIDFDDNGSFETSEQVIANDNSGYSYTVTDNFTIPLSAAPGTHRMRVRGDSYYYNAPSSPCNQLDEGETEDYSFTVIETTACTGTPAPGNTLSTVSSACSGIDFTLSLQNNVEAGTITFQWQSSVNNSTWTNISGATNSTYTTSQTTAKYYRCKVVCGSSSSTAYSTSINIPMNSYTDCYCTPDESYYSCSYSWITNVTTSGGVSDFNKSSTCASTSYSDYSSSSIASNSQLATTTMTFTSSGSAMAYSVWIDYNDNGNFENSEWVIANNNSGQTLTLTDNFTIPVSAAAGTHRMRVRGEYYYYGTPSDACNQLSYGETEDYSFTVIAASTCSGTPAPGNTISSASSVCSDDVINLSLQNSVAAIGITYQWQSSADNSTWTNISGATNSSYTTSQTSAKYYRCKITCSNSSSTAYSTEVNVAMNSIANCICIPDESYYACSYVWVTNVTTSGGVTNFNKSSTCASSSYSDFSSSSIASNSQLATTTMSFTSSGSAMAFSVWIDYNDNGVFDGSEKVISNNNTGQTYTITDNFTIPISATPGTHRMRVRAENYYYGAPNNACNQLSYGETEDYSFTVIAATPCAGTPNPGNTISTESSVCSGVSFSLSLQNNVAEGGITYQWQSSTDNSTWTNISGATNSIYTTSQTSAKYYRCAVTCTNSSSTAYSNSVNVTMNAITNCYCTPDISYYACDYVWITNVTTSGGVSDFNKNSTCASSSYSDFSGSNIASNIQLATTTMSFSSSGYAMAISVWIDYNDNGSFESSEKVISNDNTGQLLTFTDNFTIPVSATPGTHRMRVRGEYYYNGAPYNACSQLDNGETEDYSFTVIATTPCSGTPNPGNTISTANSVCADVDFTLSLQNSVAESGITYQWQSSTDNSTWTNISGATNSIYTTNQTSAKYYRCKVTCSNSSSTTYSNSVNVTMNAVTSCYCTPDESYYACDYTWITNVTTSGGVSNFNKNSTCASTSYSDFSSSNNASNTQLATTTMSFTSSGSYMAFSVWIDFNDNGSFETSEKVIENDNSGYSYTVTDNFTIPITAVPGTHRMRVRGERYYYGAPSDACNQLTYGETEDYTFTVIAAVACTGTPNPGNTISEVSSVCSGADFTLSLQNPVAESEISYQWQSSPDNSTWTNISGATNSTFTTNQTSAKYYQCIVTCSNSGLSATSTPINITMTTICEYCTSMATSTSDEEIFNVTVGTLNNSSTCSTTGGTGSILNKYSDYTAIVSAPNLTQGFSISFSIEIGTCGGNYSNGTAIFIDYNQNGDLTDSGERVYGDATTSYGTHFVTGSFTIPTSASLGSTFMRVINIEGTAGTSINPCSSYTWGETEDYIVNIIAATPCAGTPNPGNTISTANAVCSGIDFTLSLQNDVSAGGISYQWQSSTDNSTWTNISGATLATYTTNQTSAKYYRCKVTCSNSSLFTNSNSINVTMNSITDCYCTPDESNYACSYVWITNVSTSGGVTDFNKNSTCESSSYSDYSSSSIASNSQLATTTISFTSSSYAMAFSVWIDFDDNGSFDYSEQVISNDNSGQTLTLTDNFTIPITATPGTHRMRVRGEIYYYGAPYDACNQLYNGETEDYTFTVIEAVECSGTPNPGNTISTETAVCSDIDFTLSLQNSVAAIGITYQWQSSTDNSTWTNISGATNSTYTTNQTSAKYYRCKVTCSNSSSTAYSNSVNVAMNLITDCYCTPATSYSACYYTWITNVTTSGGVSDFNKSSTCSSTSYSDYSSSSIASNTQLLTTNISFTSTGYPLAFSVWIDFDDNGSFDYSEQVISNDNSGQTLTLSDSFTIPITAVPGTHRMRVRGDVYYYGAPYDACNQLDEGETEDYSFTVISTTPCSGTPNPGNTISSVSSACSGVDFILSLQNSVAESGITYQWQSSADNSTWTNISGATNATYTANQTSEKYYRCKVTCTNSSLFANSNSVNVTMNSITDCYCIPDESIYACDYMSISNVTTSGGVSDFNNSSTCASSSYSDFSSSNYASNVQLTTTTMSFTSSGYAMAFSVWIDFDDNGSFDYSEQVISDDNYGQLLTFTAQFTIPISATPGTHKMRVRGDWYSYGASSDACNQLSYGETEDYSFTVIATTPCSGTPNPGNTISSVSSACSGVDFTLSLQNSVTESGITFQWQSSVDNSTWTNISGATNSTYTTSQTSAKYYRCVVTCSNSSLSANSNSVNVTMNSITDCYCTPDESIYACDYMSISNVTTSGGVSDFNNSSSCESTSYSDFSSSNYASNIQLTTTTISFTSDGYAMAFSVWIDFDDNGSFDYSEQVISNDNYGQLLTFTDNFTIPVSATPGTHKMRVRGDWYSYGAPSDACSQLSYGETEDYSFTVIEAVECSGTPNPGNTISTESSVCSGINFTLSLQNVVAAIGITYQWQSSVDNSTWTNISGATNSTYTTNQTSEKYYRCVVTCSNSSLSANSTSLYVTIDSVTSCYCIPDESNYACDYMWISNVTTSGGLSEFNNSSSCASSSYSDFSSSYIASNSQLATTTIFFTSSGSAMAFSVWIDFNDNGSFDYSEQVISNDNNGQTLTLTDNFTIPITATTGTHRMRVRGEVYYYGAPYDACSQLYEGETEDYSFTVIAAVACSGTPSPGNTLSTVSSACSGVDFTLSLQSNITESGITYQWQSSDDNSTWTNISGATNSTYSTSQSSEKYYRCNVTCSNSGMSAYSNSVNIPMTTSCYCTPSVSYYPCSYLWISNVSTSGGLSEFNNSSACASSSYSDFSSSSIASNSQLATTTMSFTSSGYAMAYSVWIDFDDDGVFETSERVIANNNSGQAFTLSVGFTVPSNASIGIHKMRVRGEYYSYGAPSDACNQLSYGETEDYSFNVACSTSPTITATSPTSICGAGTVTLGATASSGTINWYSTFIGGGALATGSSFTTPVITSTTTYYVDATYNGCTSVTRTAITATIITMPATPSVLQNTNTLSSSTNANAYQWYLNDTLIAGATSQIFNATQSGFYKVELTNGDSCSTMSNSYYFLYVGISDIITDNTVSVYPNPANSQIIITGLNKGTIEIINIQGQIVKTLNTLELSTAETSKTTIDISKLSSGFYTIKIITDNGIIEKKLIKQ